MKHIAVVGFKNLKDFREWAYERIVSEGKDSLMGGDYYIDEEAKIQYHCILCEKDMKRKKYNELIDVDILRNEIKSRLL